MTTTLPVAGFGLSHHTAPLELRERFAFGPHARQRWYEEVRDSWPGDDPPELLLLSTCNRTECLFAGRGDLVEVQALLLERLRHAAEVGSAELEGAVRVHGGSSSASFAPRSITRARSPQRVRCSPRWSSTH